MCEISEAFKVKDRGVCIICTPCEDDNFMAAKAVKIFDESNDGFKSRDIVMEHTRQCFNNKPISPIVNLHCKVTENSCSVPENFLRRGNKVVFEY